MVRELFRTPAMDLPDEKKEDLPDEKKEDRQDGNTPSPVFKDRPAALQFLSSLEEDDLCLFANLARATSRLAGLYDRIEAASREDEYKVDVARVTDSLSLLHAVLSKRFLEKKEE